MFQNDPVVYQFRGPWGVQVDVGQSLFFLMALLVWFNFGGDPVYALVAPLLLVLAIFLHEMGHAWGTLVQDLPVRRVMLYGGGGFCEGARSRSPREAELIVAMGPIVNLALWAICSLTYYWVSEAWYASNSYPSAWAWDVIYYIWLFGYLNLMLFIFNMLPVQPLDGGKLLHLILLRVMRPELAQTVTGAIGFALAVIWIPAMLLMMYTQGWMLFFIPSIPAHYRMMRGTAAY